MGHWPPRRTMPHRTMPRLTKARRVRLDDSLSSFSLCRLSLDFRIRRVKVVQLISQEVSPLLRHRIRETNASFIVFVLYDGLDKFNRERQSLAKPTCDSFAGH